MRRVSSLEKTLMLGKIEGRRRGQHRMRWLDSITYSMDMNLSKLQEMEKDREIWHVAVHRVTKSQTWLNNWTTRRNLLDEKLVLYVKRFLKSDFMIQWQHMWFTPIHPQCYLNLKNPLPEMGLHWSHPATKLRNLPGFQSPTRRKVSLQN